MITRRRFLLTLPAVAAFPSLVLQTVEAQSFVNPLHKKSPAPLAPTFVYFAAGSGRSGAKGIFLSRFNSALGQLTPPVLIAETPHPSYLAMSPPIAGHRRLYSANEANDASASILSYLMDPASGALKPVNQVSSGGSGPCYLALDATGETAFVANYAGSSIATYTVHPDGGLSEPVVRIDFKDPKFGKRGPASARQDAPHPHSVHLSPDNRFLLVSDLGSDAISVFPVEPGAHLGSPALFTNDRAGTGPRHIAFHPNGRWIYSINELDCTIDHFLWSTTSSRTDPKGLLVNTGHFVKTIAADFQGKNTAAEIAISPDGNYVYASNRGEDSLVVFAIAPADGKLTFLQRVPCGGKTPRHFTLSTDSRWILCGNQESGSITVFRRDASNGRIGGPTQTLALDSPYFTLFA